MKRKLNFKFLLILLGGIVASMVGTVLLHNFQVHRTASHLLVIADREEKDGQLEKAANALELYVGFRKKDNDALAHYGQLLAKKAKTDKQKFRAATILEDTSRIDPSRVADLRKAAELLTDIGQHKLARPHWETLLAANKNDGVIEGKIALADFSLSKYTESDRKYIDAIKHAPTEIDLYLQHAALLRIKMKLPQRATTTMDSMVAANRDNARAYTERAKFRLGAKIAGVEADVEKARALKPDDVDVALLSAQLAIRDGSIDKAVEILTRTLGLHPDSAPICLSLGSTLQLVGKNETAIETYRNAINAQPDAHSIRFALIEALIQAGKSQEAEVEIANLRAKIPIAPSLGYLDGALLFGEKRWAESVRKLEIVVPDLASNPDLERKAQFTIGLGYEQLAAPEQALAAFRRASALSPEWAPPHIHSATCLINMGKIDDAVREYRSLPASTPGVRTSLIGLLAMQNSRLPVAERKWDEIDSLVADVEKAAPRSIESLTLRFEYLLSRGRLDEARALIEKGHVDHPDQAMPTLGLASLLQEEKKPGEALKLLDEAEKKFGDVANIRLAKIRYWTAAGGPDAAKNIALLRTDLNKFNQTEQESLLDRLAIANTRLGNTKESSQLLDASIERSPENLRLRIRQLEYALESEKDEAIGEVVQQLRRIEGENGVYWRVGEASRIVIRGEREKSKVGFQEARVLLDFVKKRRPDSIDADRLLGMVDDMEGNPDGAIAHYQQVFKSGSRRQPVPGRLASLLVVRGRFAEANSVLMTVESEGMKGSYSKKLVAEVAVRANDLVRGLKLVEAAVSPDSKEAGDLIWQAQMFLLLKKYTEAEAVDRRAVAILPKSASARLTLIQILAQSGDRAKATAEAAEAEKAFSADNRLELAQMAVAIGNIELAQKRYDEALAARPADSSLINEVARFSQLTNQTLKAETLYRKLLDPSLAVEKSVLAEVRRSLAQVLISQRRLKAIDEAESLVDRNLAESPRSIPDLKLRPMVLSTIPGRQKEAIRAFEKSRDAQPLTAEEGLQLAQVLDLDGQWSQARQQVLALLSAPTLPYRPAVWYISRLLKRNEPDEASLWLTKLEAIDPKPLDLTILKARWFHAMKRDAEALALFETRLKESPDAAPLLSQVLEVNGDATSAIRIVRAYAATSKRPTVSLLLAEILARHGQLPEAVDICEAAWSTCPPVLVGNSALAICDSVAGRSDPVTRARLAKRIEAAIEKNPKVTPLSNTLAQILLMDGRFKEAEAAYLRGLDIAPNDISITNNYAWMLAFAPGRESDALATAERAIALEGPEPHLIDTRGLAYLAKGEILRAIADFETSIAGSPNDVATVHFHLALAKSAANDPIAANEELHRGEVLGFKPEALHPIEAPSYKALRAALVGKK